MTEKKKIDITLTGRPPVKIVAADWPVIADVDAFDGQHECQANTVWRMKVRGHADGRHIVYGWQKGGPGGRAIGERAIYAGYLLLPSEHAHKTMHEVTSAIAAVGVAIENAPLADDCVASLPAEELT